MKIEFLDNEETSTQLQEEVDSTTPLKEILVNYVGNKLTPEDDSVTVEMIVETLANEFPEFMMAIAEENWIRGYQQALTDVSIGEKLHKQEEENA